MLLLSLALPALAAPDTTEDVTLEGRLIEYRQRTELDFEDLEVTAGVARPTGHLFTETGRPVFNRMLWIRKDWNDEVKFSADEVK